MLQEVVELLESARRASVRTVNAIMTATNWELGRRIIESERGGKSRAQYGDELIVQLSHDLTSRFGRGYSALNLRQMRRFYLAWPVPQIRKTVSSESSRPIHQTASSELATPLRKSDAERLQAISQRFLLPWSHYFRLLSVENDYARKFYEDEALSGGWSVRQ
jgi:hypothetical protein